MKRSIEGMTLLETMVVVLIIAVVSSLSYGSYSDYVERAKRQEARKSLLLISVRQEAFFLSNGTYTTALADLGFKADDQYITDSGDYAVRVEEANNVAYTAAAVRLGGGERGAECGLFRLTSDGRKISQLSPDCWER